MSRIKIVFVSFFLFNLLFSIQLIGQVRGNNCFDVNYLKGCNPLQVTLTSCLDEGVEFIYTFKLDGVTEVPISGESEVNFTFDRSGTWKVIQTISQNINDPTAPPSEDSLTVEVVNGRAPFVEVVPCDDRRILLTVNDEFYDYYVVDFGDGNNTEVRAFENIQHRYANEGIQTVTVYGFFNDGVDFIRRTESSCSQYVESVNVVNTLVPSSVTGIEIGEDNTIQLGFDLASSLSYVLEERVNDGESQEIQTIQAPDSVFSLLGRDIENSVYCYRIGLLNPCTGDILYGSELCTNDIQSTSDDRQNMLTWLIYPPSEFQNYQIFRDGELLTTITDRATNTFTDIDVICLENYTYELVINASNLESRSNTTTVQTISTTPPPTVSNLFASIEANTNEVNWTNPEGVDIRETFVERAINSTENFALVFNPEDSVTKYSDMNAPFQDNIFCYRVQIKDECDNISDTLTTCTTLLSGEKDVRDNRIQWTPFQGFTEFFYFVEVLTDTTTREVSRTIGPIDPDVFEFVDLAEDLDSPFMYYRIRVQDARSDNFSYSNVIAIVEPLLIEIPDAFTPNGDRLNDTYYVRTKFISEFRLDIYNRWGTAIFTALESNEEWDGTLQNGKEAPVGAYTYVVEAKDVLGREFSRKGILTLIR